MPKYKGKHFSYTPSGLMNFTSSKIDDLEKKKKLTNKEEENLEYIKVLVSRNKCQKVKVHMVKKLVGQKKEKLPKKEKNNIAILLFIN